MGSQLHYEINELCSCTLAGVLYTLLPQRWVGGVGGNVEGASGPITLNHFIMRVPIQAV